ncbi:ATP-binding protein [Streptomyces sp. NBC_00249]|uniref:ATP-binding protein n=1 Tax=Streptomyces sp. NBC_00249 TaxID=2975690 RepID=UPI00225920C5|nr:ATP-binding protein [Streptomyces sp. NBC_00249]MCX5194692.1 ATP-binding protein [Streptomyces sp. NBC_00249]
MRIELTAVTIDFRESAMSSPFLSCPTSPASTGGDPPSPEALACSLTVPGAPSSAQIARAAVRSVLHAYRLDPLAPCAEQVTGELVATAWRLDPGRSLYLAVRYRDDALRLSVYDGHALHPHPRLAAHCEARRRASLRVMAAVVRDCGGAWGFGESREPGGGTRTWASLPRVGAARYLG